MGLQTHGPVMCQLTQCRFTSDVQEGLLRLRPGITAVNAHHGEAQGQRRLAS